MTRCRVAWDDLAGKLRQVAAMIEAGQVTALSVHAEARKPARIALEGRELEDWEDTQPAVPVSLLDGVVSGEIDTERKRAAKDEEEPSE